MHANEIESTLKEFGPSDAPVELEERISQSFGHPQALAFPVHNWNRKRYAVAAGLAVALVTAALVLGALTRAGYNSANAGAALVPIIEIETEAYDLGLIANDKSSNGNVVVHNRGTAPLTISKVTTACGCTKGVMSRDVIPPGEDAQLQITVDPFRIPQFQSTKTLTLFTNDPEKPTVKLAVSARLNPEVRFVPDQIDFGTIAQGKSAEQSVRVIQNTEEPLMIERVELVGQAEYFEYGYEEIEPAEWENPDRREYIVTANLLPNAPAGNMRVNIVLETNFKRLPRIVVLVVAEVQGVYTIEPEVVTLRSIDAGETVRDVLKISSLTPIDILEVNTENPHLAVSKRAGEQPNSYVFDVAIADGATQRWQRDSWNIKVKAQDREFTEVVKVMVIVNVPSGGGDVVEN